MTLRAPREIELVSLFTFFHSNCIFYHDTGLLLEKQGTGSTIPRFNPHGYQPPPTERKKEPEMSPMKGFGVVKKR